MVREIFQGREWFVTAAKTISLAGTTEPDAQVLVQTATGAVRASAYSDANGIFALNLPLEQISEDFDIAIVARSGFVSTQKIGVRVDAEPPEIELSQRPPRTTAKAKLVLAGRVKKGSMLVLNGRQLEVVKGEFSQTLQLRPGANRFEMTATDLLGRVALKKWVVKLDQSPPTLLRHTLKARATRDRGILDLDVVVRDASGLARAAPFVVKAGDKIYRGYLRYNRATRSYRGTLEVPAAATASAALAQVDLVDAVGNSRKVFVN